MKYYWLNKQNNENLIVFFGGWSFDYNPFILLDCSNYDVLMFYDYNYITMPKTFSFTNYKTKILISWSMGVFSAFLHKNIFENFDKKIAINGTLTPVDNNFGIPVKIFELTLKYAQKSLEGNFYQNIFHTENEYLKYCKNPIIRTIENQISELENLYKTIKSTNIEDEKFYNHALISQYDKIIPPNNQLRSHKKNNVEIIKLPYGHHLFYNYTSWDEIVKLCQ